MDFDYVNPCFRHYRAANFWSQKFISKQDSTKLIFQSIIIQTHTRKVTLLINGNGALLVLNKLKKKKNFFFI